MVDIVFPERLDVPLIAPVVDGSFSVAGDFGNSLCSQHVGIVAEQLGIIKTQMLPHDWGNLFLYTDFEKACDNGNLTFEEERETDPIPFEVEAEQKVFDYLCLAETVKYFRPVIHSSLYTMLFPPFLKKRTKKAFSVSCIPESPSNKADGIDYFCF